MSQQTRFLESPTLSQLYLWARCVLYYFTTTHVYTRHVTIYVFILQMNDSQTPNKKLSLHNKGVDNSQKNAQHWQNANG